MITFVVTLVYVGGALAAFISGHLMLGVGFLGLLHLASIEVSIRRLRRQLVAPRIVLR